MSAGVSNGAEGSVAEAGVGERRRSWLGRSRLYFVCDIKPGGRPLDQVLRAALKGGVDIAQLRDKEASEKELIEAGKVFRKLCDAYDALFIVNDWPDLAIACTADGVHLGQGDTSAAKVRERVGEDMLIGISTHSSEQIEAASRSDYISVGPVYKTPTKPDYREVGLELVTYASENARQPFFAIGGINPENVGDVVQAGAERVAVVRAIAQVEDPESAAATLKERFEGR